MLENLEKRVLMSTTVAAWSFDQLSSLITSPTSVTLNPAPSTGTGTALTVGLQTSSANSASPGGVYAYPNANASGTGDISDILNGTGNNGTSDVSSTGATGSGDASGINPAWRARGNSDGWSDNALVGTQGVQFTTSTVGDSGISLSFDLDPSSASAPSEIQVQYTTDGSTWVNATSLTTPISATGGTSDVTIATNSTNPNIVNGSYFQIANSGTTPDALFWQNGFKADFSGIAAANNNAHFGVRIVNAATGSAEFEVGGTAYPAAGAGNWRFDNVQILANGGTLSAPSITTNPTSQSVAAGQPVTFTAAASGNPAPTVQWYKGAVGSGIAISGATSTTLTFTTLADGSENGSTYYAVFTNSQGSASTTAATLSDALAVPTITTNPSSVSVTAGTPVTFTAAATGSPVPTVQWQSAPSGSTTYTPISGATSTSYTVTATTALSGTTYEAVFTNSQGSVTTTPATLTASGALITAWNFNSLAVGTNLSPTPSTGNGSASSVGMQATGTPGVAPYPTANATGPDTSNITAGTGSNGGSSDGSVGNIWRIVGTNGWNSSTGLGTQGAQFNASSVGYNNLGLQFDLYATTQGEGNFQVQYTSDGSTWNNVPASDLSIGSDSGIQIIDNSSGTHTHSVIGGYFHLTGGQNWYNTLTANLSGFTAVNNDANFGVRIVNASQGTDCVNASGTTALNNTSGNWRFDEVQINGANIPVAPAITTQPVGATVNAGSTATFSAAASGYPVPTVQWYTGTPSGTHAPISGATSTTYTTPATTSANNGTTYYAVFTNSLGSATTNTAALTVNSAPVITLQPIAAHIAAGSSVTFTASATGNPTPTVQWQINTGSGFTNIAGATSTSYTATASTADEGALYQAVFTNSAGSVTTNSVSLTVIGGAISQWIFNSNNSAVDESRFYGSGGDAAMGASGPLASGGAVGGPDVPLPTFTYSSTDQAQTLGLFNAYQGSDQSSGADIFNTNAPSTINPNFKPYAWRIRSGHTITGWSQLAPQGVSSTDGAGNVLDPQGVMFKVNTTGYSDITLRFDWAAGGIADMQPQYSPDGGNTWLNAGNILEAIGNDYPGITSTTTPPGFFVNLSGISAANNNPNFELRLVAAYSPNLPLISDGNSFEPLAVHGQYADASAGAQNAQQVLNLDGYPAYGNESSITGGTYELTFEGQTTAPIAYNASPADVQAALDALSTIGSGGVTVYETAITPTNPASGFIGTALSPDLLTINFSGGALAHAIQPTLTLTNNLQGPNAADASVTTWVPGAAGASVGANGYELGVTRYQDGGSGWELSDFSFNGLSNVGAPTLISNPANTTVVGGTTATFTAVDYSETSPTSAQWQINTGSGWSNIAGATNYVASTSTSTYSFTTNLNLSDSGHMFRVVFTNPNGSTTSLPATLTTVVAHVPTVTAQPSSLSVQVGFNAVFTASATGTPTPTIQWQVSSNAGSSWTNLSDDGVYTVGSTTNTLVILAQASQVGSNYEYRAVFTNVAGTTNSNPAVVTVLAPETTVTDWNFSTHSQSYDNSPSPSIGTGTATGLGFNIPYNPSDPASGTQNNAQGYGAVNADDVTSAPGLANPAFVENVWRIRGGVTATAGGAPANGWSNFAKEYTQGAQFSSSTAGYGSIYVTMDWYSTKSGELNARQQFTLDGINWYNLDDYNPANPQVAWNGSTNALTGLDNLDPNDPIAPLNGPADDFYGATAVYSKVGISSVSLTNNVATIVATNSYKVGQTINIAGVSPSQFNGVFTITAVAADGSSFSYALTGANVPSTPQGSAASASLGGYIVPLVFNLTGVAGAANNPNFGVRLVNAYNPSLPLISSTLIGDPNPTTHGQYAIASSIASPTAYPGAAGNWRFDNIVFHGVATTPTWYTPGNSTYTWNAQTETLTITGGTTGTITADPAGTGDSPKIVVSGAGTNILFNSPSTTIHIGGLSISGGATAAITGSDVLVVASGGNVSFTGGSTLDLQNNGIDFAGGAGSLSTYNSLLGSSIISSTVAPNGLTTLGISTGPSAGLTYRGASVGSGDVLVRETYYGDADLNGLIDGSDYSRIDNGYLNHLAGWANGDFNGDGVVDGSDYTLIDNAYNRQGAQITDQIATPATQFATTQAVATTFSDDSIISSFDDLKKKTANVWASTLIASVMPN